MTAAAPVAGDLRSVVEGGLGVAFRVDRDPYALGVDALAGLALRDNPRRAQLVVSRVLGKHLPVRPAAARAAALLLAGEVGRALGRPLPGLDGGLLTDPARAAEVDPLARARPGDAVVLAFCETATGLGQLVAEALGAHGLATTRRPDPALPVLAGFDEEHSHAVAHALQVADPAVLADPARPLVLVDDELTSGRTALNTVAALQATWPRERYVVASLLDLRPPAARAAFRERAAGLGVQVDVVALLDGELLVPDDVLERARDLRDRLAGVPVALAPDGSGRLEVLDGAWPAGLPRDARTGLPASRAAAVQDALEELALRLVPRLSGGPVLVLGTEELMWAPLRLAALLPGEVACQSTTRSPVLPADVPGYAVRRVLHFPAPDEPGRASRLHGLPDAPYADVVVVVDTPAADALPLAEALRPWATASVQVVQL